MRRFNLLPETDNGRHCGFDLLQEANDGGYFDLPLLVAARIGGLFDLMGVLAVGRVGSPVTGDHGIGATFRRGRRYLRLRLLVGWRWRRVMRRKRRFGHLRGGAVVLLALLLPLKRQVLGCREGNRSAVVVVTRHKTRKIGGVLRDFVRCEQAHIEAVTGQRDIRRGILPVSRKI